MRTAEDTARAALPAGDRMPLVGGDSFGQDWEGPPAETSIGVFERVGPGLGEAFARSTAQGEVLFGYAEHEMRTTYLASSAGLRARFDQPTGHVELNAKSADFGRSAWIGAATTDFAEVDIPRLAEEVSARLEWARRRVDLPAGRYQTLLPPSAVADLMICLYWAAGARDAHDGETVFSRPGGGTRVGDRLGDEAVTIRSDPAAPFLQCPPFVLAHRSSSTQSVYDNGLPLEPIPWIDRGELTALVQTRRSAELTGLPVTPYVDNLIMDGPAGAPTLDAMVATTERGLLLTCLWYIREVDPQTLLLTGLTRDGVYLVEGGEIVGAVNNFRFNESPVDLLGRIAEIGKAPAPCPGNGPTTSPEPPCPPCGLRGSTCQRSARRPERLALIEAP